MKRWLALPLLVVAVAVAAGLFWNRHRGGGAVEPTQLMVYCAAGLKQPVEEVVRAFEAETGMAVTLQYGGTGTLLSQMALAHTGDLFIAADAGAQADAAKKQLIGEAFPLVQQTPVIAVRAGNPLQIRGLQDLLRADVRTALANPEAASIGRSVKATLGERWTELAAKATVMKPTVTELAADLSLGAVDAAIVWDSVIGQFKDLVAVAVPEFEAKPEVASVCVLSACAQTPAAMKLARYLTAPEKGGASFAKRGMKSLAGDAWAAEPELLIYSGAVNRPALEPLLRRFADREGVRVNTVYNGCGVLCASLKTIAQSGGHQLPDAYFACDLCFVPPVAAMFPQVNVLTETEIVITVPKGNPRGIKGLSDLAQPGLKLGVCNQQQSTLGFMTAGLLKESGLGNAVRANVAVEVPTADFLINQMRAGGLDAAIVYLVNVLPQTEHLEAIKLPETKGRAVQPFAVRQGSPNALAAGRLLTFLQAHREEFEKAGFSWRGTEAPVQSSEIKVPDWLKQ